ncbi:TSUP family transporter [Sorangium sp. So ce124]|uniref:TSUP family transporter n=1 Tax=Sorangium sp. So ce124 TaxID=3133280 RepID=UPI003F61B2FA
MARDILIAVVITAAIQSVFGVGVLLFGTPILLLLGYSFTTTLTVLLPISISINLLQIVQHWPQIDWPLFRRILLYTIPFIVACLALVTSVEINVGFIIGPFLVLVALKDFSRRIGAAIESLIRYERTYLVTMGVVHGLTNLGGSLLTALVHAKKYDKDATRVTTAIGYCAFAVFQIATLVATATHARIDYGAHAIYVATGIAVFLLVDRLVYVRIDNARYRRLFAAFLFASGVLLTYRAFARSSRPGHSGLTSGSGAQVETRAPASALDAVASQ